MNYVIIAIGVAILIYDGILASKDKMTISQKCQEFFPPVIDWIIGISGWIGLGFVKHYFPEFDFMLAVFLAGFWGHIWIANKERYKKD